MTSGNPVTQNAINFTPDNKRAFAYSGVVSVTNAKVNLIEFDTNTEYLASEVYIFNGSGSGDDIEYTIEFNDVIVMKIYYLNTIRLEIFKTKIIVPPFTNVKITGDNIQSSTGRDHTAHVYAKAVGMTETGYQ